MSGSVQGKVAGSSLGAARAGIGGIEASCRAHAVGWTAVVVAVALFAGLTTPADAVAQQTAARLAAALASRDPGARLDGTTVVVAGAGARVYGVPGRPNFVAALGSHETIVGGNREDDLAGLGDDDTILGGAGNDFIYGGRGVTLVAGSGHDLLVARGADATVRLTGGNDTVIAAGRDDRVLCSPGSRGDVVYAGASDSVSSTCRADHARILPLERLRYTARAAVNPSDVKGDGSNNNPFYAPCESYLTSHECSISFPRRTLVGAWKSEYVPAYRCPVDHPFLINRQYFGPLNGWSYYGVQVLEDRDEFPIAIAINDWFTTRPPYPPGLVYGTMTGPLKSLATNWIWGSDHWYQIVLHCTDQQSRGWYF